MKLSEALLNLYFSEIDYVISTLNSSIYAKEYPFDKDQCKIIHTGFIFEMQNGKINELFYDFVNCKLIRQPRFSNNPPVLGLVYFFWNDWIQVWDHKIVLSVDENKGEAIPKSFENADDVYKFEKFEIIFGQPSKKVTINGLTHVIEERVFFNGSFFKKIIEDEYF